MMKQQKEEQEALYEEKEDNRDYESLKPYSHTALPRIKTRIHYSRPIPGVSYLAQTGMYDEVIAKRHAAKGGNITRRNITEYKISSNILAHNSPVAAQNFDNLNLGP